MLRELVLLRGGGHDEIVANGVFLMDTRGDALGDPRVRTDEADVVQWLADAPAGSLDAICLDADNDPEWLVAPGNARLYADDGLRAATKVLHLGGVIAIWGAAPMPAFVARMEDHFDDVDVTEVPASRGEPDVVVVGRSPRC